jgi:hypothetical protein
MNGRVYVPHQTALMAVRSGALRDGARSRLIKEIGWRNPARAMQRSSDGRNLAAAVGISSPAGNGWREESQLRVQREIGVRQSRTKLEASFRRQQRLELA